MTRRAAQHTGWTAISERRLSASGAVAKPRPEVAVHLTCLRPIGRKKSPPDFGRAGEWGADGAQAAWRWRRRCQAAPASATAPKIAA